MTFTLAELAARVGGEAVGDGSLRLTGVAALDDAGPEQVSFFANRKYRAAFQASRAGVVVVEPEEQAPAGRPLLRVRNAYLAFAKITTLFHPAPQAVAGVAASAVVHPTARVDPSAQLSALVSVGAGAVIGARAILHPGVQIGEGAAVGEDCLLHPNAVVRERCVLGARVILQPGVVIGSDGFGFAFDMEGEGQGPRHYKFPQVGIVVVEDDVELGANTCVDRAALGVTRIGRGTKIDNLVQVAHNVEIGPLCLLVAQSGVAGSSKLGTGVVVAAQVGIIGHLRVGDGTRVGGQSGVMNDLGPGETVIGTPARPHKDWLRTMASLDHLTEMRRELTRLRKEVERLGGGKERDE